MPLRKVKFIATGHAHAVGNFATDDVFTGDAEVCRHLVEDARCAVWDDVQTSGTKPVAADAEKASAKTRRAAGKRG